MVEQEIKITGRIIFIRFYLYLKWKLILEHLHLPRFINNVYPRKTELIKYFPNINISLQFAKQAEMFMCALRSVRENRS